MPSFNNLESGNYIMSVTPTHLKSCTLSVNIILLILTFTYFISLYIATYDTQSIDITSTSGEVCVVCRFSTNTIAVGCELQLRNSTMTLSGRFDRDVNNIAEGCISNVFTGYYDLYVYDVENDNTLSQLPAIIKNQVFVDEQTTTTTSTTTVSTTMTTGIMTTTSSVSNALSPTIPSTS